MKKIFIISALVLLFTSCDSSPKEIMDSIQNFFSSESSSKKFNSTITLSIYTAEIAVSEHDKDILSALKNNEIDSIASITKKTLLKLAKERNLVEGLKAPGNGNNLKKATENYLESLTNLVKAQAVYAHYSDTISEEDITTMDETNKEAVAEVESMHSKFVEYQKAFVKTNK